MKLRTAPGFQEVSSLFKETAIGVLLVLLLLPAVTLALLLTLVAVILYFPTLGWSWQLGNRLWEVLNKALEWLMSRGVQCLEDD